jgi:hypothetical protein
MPERDVRRWWLKTTAVVPTGQRVTFTALKRNGLQAGMAIAGHWVQKERIGEKWQSDEVRNSLSY